MRKLLSLAIIAALIILGRPANATISVLQTVENHDPNGSTSGTTIAVTITVATLGNMLHMFTMWHGDGDVSTVTDTGSNTWTLLDAPAASPFGPKVKDYVATPGASGSLTVTVTFGTANVIKGIAIAEIGGTSALQVHTSASSNSPGTGADAVSTGNMTPTSQPALVSAFSWNSSENAFPASGTGFTAGITTWGYTTPNMMQSEWKRITSTSAVAATFTATVGGDQYRSVGAVFTEASSGVTYDSNFFGGGP